MSQYPSPYSPPPYSQGPGYYQPYAIDPLRNAKRAGLLMIIVGAITVLFALCMVGIGQMIKTNAMPPDFMARIHDLESNGVSAAAAFLAMGVGFLLFAILQILFGIFVRRGNTVAIILSLIGTSIVVLFGFLILASSLDALVHGSPQVLVGLIFWVVPLSLMILQLVWLVGALRAGPQVTWAQQQYQAQYWQYQQNMHSYGGYAAPPPREGNSER